jgi:hypothetical protein
MRRLMYLATIVMLTGSGTADAQATRGGEGRGALPSLDIDSSCRDVANNDLNKTSDYSGCIAEEGRARDGLRKEWASYAGDMREQCMHLVTPPALPSYVTLQNCLQMSREARNLSKTDGAAIGKTMQAPEKD